MDQRTLGQVICRQAESVGAALVVMGRSRRAALSALLFGDAAAYVQKHCKRPLRLVTADELALGRAGNA
jgi:nucleotide-binding universal stress UspA family protein